MVRGTNESDVIRVRDTVRIDISVKLLLIILGAVFGLYQGYKLDQKNREVAMEQLLQEKLDKEIYFYDKQLTMEKVKNMDKVLTKMDSKIDKMYEILMKEGS